MMNMEPLRRGLVVGAIKESAAAPGWTFHRGPIQWANWDFAAHPKTMALFFADYDLMPAGNEPFRRATLVFEVLTKLPGGRADEEMQFDDSGLDKLSTEFLAILLEALAKRDANGDPIIVRIHNDPPAGVREMADQTLGVQGIEVTVTIDY